jgi:hypothetical protein
MPEAALPAMIYRPAQTAAGPRAACASCEHFHGEWLARGVHALCRRGARVQVQARPGQGCAFHLRAAGAD